jgi:hypothetical protein
MLVGDHFREENKMSALSSTLKSLLPDLSAGRYVEINGLIVFGADSFDELMDHLLINTPEEEEHEEQSEVYEKLRKFLDDLNRHTGRDSVRERATLNPPSEFKSDAFKDASSEEIRQKFELIRKVLTVKPVLTPQSEEKAVERALIEELLGKVPKAVTRAISLERLEYGSFPVKHLKGYFEEAHRCYLYGFNIACAVLCRAIVETALKNVVDPMSIVERSKKPEDSYIQLLAFEAERGGILTDDRPQCVLDIRDAGNAAIHSNKHPEFEVKWLPKLGEIIDGTRKVLIDLYPNQA